MLYENVKFNGTTDLIKRLKFFISLIFYRLTLDFSYIFFVSVYYKYAGFDLDFNPTTYFFSWIIYFSCFFLLNEEINKISDFFLLIAVLTVFGPLTCLYGLDDRSFYPILCNFLSFFVIHLICSFKYKYKYPYLKEGRFLSIFFSILLVLLSVAWVFMSGAFSNANISFTAVYDFRETNSEILNIGIFGYLNSWVTKVFNILLITYFLVIKRYFFVLILILVQILFFSVMSVKSIVFYPFLVLGAWFYFQKNNSSVILPMILISIILFTYLLYFVFDNIYIPSWIIRRVFFVPGDLTYTYFEFFKDNPHIYWSNSLLSSYLDYPYDMKIPELIGNYLNTGSYNNNGFISIAYAHADIWGVLIYSVIIALLLRVLNNLCFSGIPMWVCISLTVVPFRSLLMNSDLPTTLLTHGLLISILFLFFLRTKNA